MSLVIANQLGPEFSALLAGHPVAPTIIDVPEERPWEAAADADVLIVRPAPAWRAAPADTKPALWPGRVRWVCVASAGVDFYPPWLLDAPLVNCGRGVASEEIADYVIAAIYAQAKDLVGAAVTDVSQWGPRRLGRVSGSTVGILGFGAIGQALARRALALGAQVTAVRRRAKPADVSGVELLGSAAEVVASADHLVIAVPATAETRHLVDAALLAHARPHAHLINIARGSIVDQDALLAALDADRLAFATLDVTDPEPLPAGHPLYTHPRIRITPHISSNYLSVRHLLADKIAKDLSRFARGERPSDLVDPALGY